MDLLWNVYSNASNNEEEEEGIKQTITPPSPKRLKPDNPFTHTKFHHPLPESTQCPILQAEAPVPGRYISKRERAFWLPNLLSPAAEPECSCHDLACFWEYFGFRRSSRCDVVVVEKQSEKGSIAARPIPPKNVCSSNKLTKAVNAVHWSPTHGEPYLFMNP